MCRQCNSLVRISSGCNPPSRLVPGWTEGGRPPSCALVRPISLSCRAISSKRYRGRGQGNRIRIPLDTLEHWAWGNPKTGGFVARDPVGYPPCVGRIRTVGSPSEQASSQAAVIQPNSQVAEAHPRKVRCESALRTWTVYGAKRSNRCICRATSPR